jgi:hypothetical protein
VSFEGSPANESIFTPWRAARAKGPSSPCSLAPRMNSKDSKKSLRDKNTSEAKVRAAEGPKFGWTRGANGTSRLSVPSVFARPRLLHDQLLRMQT